MKKIILITAILMLSGCTTSTDETMVIEQNYLNAKVMNDKIQTYTWIVKSPSGEDVVVSLPPFVKQWWGAETVSWLNMSMWATGQKAATTQP